MSPALHHFKHCKRAIATSASGLLCSTALVLVAVFVVVLHAEASRKVHPALVWLITAGAFASIPVGVAGGIEHILGSRNAHPALPINDRLRRCLEGLAWLPIWLLLAAAFALIALGTGAGGGELFLIGVLLSVPGLILSGFLPSVGTSSVLPATALGAVQATCLHLAIGGPGLVAAGVVLTGTVIALGPRIHALPPLVWRGRIGSLTRPPRNPLATLRADAIRGVGRSALGLLPWAAFPPLLALFLLRTGAPLGDAPPAETLAWACAAGVCFVVGGTVFFPLGLTGRTIGAEGLNNDMDGSFGQAWSTLPVSRRAVALAVYLPALVAALAAVGGVLAISWSSGVRWASTPTPLFALALLAYAVMTPALVTAGLVGETGPRRFAAGALLAVLIVTLVAAITREPVAVGVVIGGALLVGVGLPVRLLREPVAPRDTRSTP